MINYNFVFLIFYMIVLLWFSSSLLITPCILIYKFNKNIGFNVKNMYYISLSFILKYLMDIEIFVNSKIIFEKISSNNKDKNILISNHLTEIDFMLTTFIVNKFDHLKNIKIISVSKKIIGFFLTGIYMFIIISKDILLDRNINKDYDRLSNNNNANLFFIYPEGTCFDKEKKIISDNYTQKNNLPSYKYLLYPRLTGLEIILKKFKYNKIYDITLVYDTIDKKMYGKNYDLLTFIYKYKFPRRIFINIDKYNLTPDIKVKTLIESIFLKKDMFIENFNPNANKFEPIKYNNKLGLVSFILTMSFSLFSLYLFYSNKYIRMFYLLETLLYFSYLIFIY